MVTRDRIAQLATEHGLGDIGDELAALAMPALRLEDAGERPATGATKLGGLPDLPVGVAWPHAPWPGYEHEAMTFFGQVALDDLDPEIWPGPREGLLSFFCRQSPEYYGVDVGGAAKVLHLPAGAELRQADPPDGLFEEFLLDEEAVRARHELTLPTIAVDLALVLMPFGFGWDDPREDERRDRYGALTEAVAVEQGLGMRPEGSWPAHHRLLGWPRHVQGDVLPEIVQAHTDVAGRDAGDGLDDHAAWRLLLQVDGSFGDGGTLFFGVPADDLPAGRFDRVQAMSQSG